MLYANKLIEAGIIDENQPSIMQDDYRNLLDDGASLFQNYPLE
jgi:2-oxoglutarate dehydrogenase complex dehydrogenase (E1) component-like enzyme